MRIGLRQIVLVLLAVTLAAGGPLAAQDPQQRDLVRVRADEDRPWLMINSQGHTAAVRALAFAPDSKHLYSAGLDKVVHVWNTSAITRDLRRTHLLERTIRWPVNRGLRGSINALAVAPNDGLLAIAGYGASNDAGEIRLVNPVDGTFVKLLHEHRDAAGRLVSVGHRNSVGSLAFSRDGQWLASLDYTGRAILWKRGGGDWKPSMLYDDDVKVYGKENANLISLQPKFRRLAMLGDKHVVVPVFINAKVGRPQWNLQQINLSTRKVDATFDKTVHVGVVTALAASADGRRLASADQDGNVFIWDLASKDRVRKLQPGRVVHSLSLTPDSKTLAAGTAVDNDKGTSELQLWDVGTGKIASRQPLELEDDVWACAISPNGEQLAYSGGANHAVFVGATASSPKSAELRGSARRVVKVAFVKEAPIYRVAFGTAYEQARFNDYGPLDTSFDPKALSLSGHGAVKDDDWLGVEWAQGDWSASRAIRAGRTILQLSQGGKRRGVVSFPPEINGNIICFCWIPDANGKPVAIAVGTDVQNSIFVCRLGDDDPCPILRHFRGHFDYVTSLGVSGDARYLVSGSADGTLRIWSLSACQEGEATKGRWGGEFAIEDGELVVKKVDPAGPLFFRGVRPGDVLMRIGWFDEKQPDKLTDENDPAKILWRLVELPWQNMILFEFTRNRAERPPFQLLPAWQPLANLFVSDRREWAFWTPEGYYDASANGHTLFGWQVNRGVEGLDAKPDFHRADQFRKNLERPDVLERLLPTGNLDASLRQAGLQPPAEPDQVVAQQIRSAPRVQILSPGPGEAVTKNAATVRAMIDVPEQGELEQAKAFANGVVARGRKLVEERQVEGRRQHVYEWEAGLTSDDRILIQVVAGTAAKTASFDTVTIERRQVPDAPARPPRLYLLAVGVDKYKDPAIQPLAFAVADARSVADFVQGQATGPFTLARSTLRVNDEVTQAGWKAALAEISDQLRADAQPDDLLLIFMAGHGFVDTANQQYHFASFDMTAENVVNGVYDGSISWGDFEPLADVPCRKLALLDTCHSGAIQPLRTRDLKAAIRALQEDVILSVAASAGDERSEEKAAWQHGAFTKTLLDGLAGEADTSADGAISLDELIAYVKATVPKLTDGRQNPTAAPDDLLPFISLRLAGGAAADVPAKSVKRLKPPTADGRKQP
ncbi:MAG TPA: hypothetical protein VND64_33855 [Pirellulales bacterium]|nr:hypothetical protein [Pirellulales bacterium]